MINRKGSFVVSRSLVMTDIERFAKMFAGFIPMYMEKNLFDDTVTYWGVHPQFDEVAEGTISPRYKPIISSNLDGEVHIVTWKKVVDTADDSV